MTVNSFLEDLCDELKLLFKDFQLKDETGKLQSFNIFEQSLPIPSGEDEPEPFPYIVVRAADGGKTAPEDYETVRVMLIIGIFDDELNNQGHKDVLNSIDCIRQRFERNPLLENKYYKLSSEQYPFRWTLPEEDTHPFFFGGVEMTFAVASIEQEDIYS